VTGRRGSDIATGVHLGGDAEHSGIQTLAAFDLHDHVAVHGPALFTDELGLGLGELLGERGRVRGEAAVVVWRQVGDITVGYERAATGQDRLVGLRLALHGVEDLDGVHDPLEHLREGPFDQAFQSLLKALQHAHSRPFRCATVPVPLRLAAVLALTSPPRWFLEDMMVSAPRTPVRAPIRRGDDTLPRRFRCCARVRRYPARPSAGPRSILVHATGWSNCPLGRYVTWGSGGMADAHGSGPCARKGVGVQLPPSPPAGLTFG